ncbi:MAG: hypothetical protein PF440_00400 [Thiomicrorhabdus sp.]|jgi:hypothetical protein|nr:hypothetical protein [Thiomicrorhabdus sp.]
MHKKQTNHKLIKCWADGAFIQYRTVVGKVHYRTIVGKMHSEWTNTSHPDWNYSEMEFRIEPLCEYALAAIGEQYADLYVYWIKGGNVTIDTHWALHPIDVIKSNDPFTQFLEVMKRHPRSKKVEITEVMWICVELEAFTKSKWININEECQDTNWHKVPSMKRTRLV